MNNGSTPSLCPTIYGLHCKLRSLKGAVSYFTHMLLRITNLKALGQRFQVYRIQNGVLSGGRAWWETR